MKSGSKGSHKELQVFSQMSLVDLNKMIEACIWSVRNGGTTAGRKSFFKRLILLGLFNQVIQ